MHGAVCYSRTAIELYTHTTHNVNDTTHALVRTHENKRARRHLMQTNYVVRIPNPDAYVR